MDSKPSNFRRLAVWIVFVHAALVLVHGVAHAGQRIQMSPAANLFIAVVIVIGPFVALILLRLRLHSAGALTLAATMGASFLFGLWNHFLIHGSDDVAHLQDDFWKLPFQVTAWLLLATEFAGCAAGYRLLRARALPTS